MQSTYATGLNNPRGLAFDSIGNLFATTAHNADDIDLGKVLKFNPRNHVNTVGSAAHFFFEGLAIDIAGNAYVMATDDRSPTGASTIFKFTPNGDRIVFGSIPGQGWGLAFDSTGNLYAAEGGINFGGERAIYKFAPDGTSTVFADSDQFAEGEYPIGLAFDSSSGNLYVSIETFTDPEADSIVYFTPMGVKSTFATRLTTPRGLAFDSSRNLFVAEANAIPDGDILKFTPGGVRSTFATGFGRPEFLTFGPPR
ncbi:MAG: NHL repeat-containing protein [Chthoniobacterales bacterium]